MDLNFNQLTALVGLTATIGLIAFVIFVGMIETRKLIKFDDLSVIIAIFTVSIMLLSLSCMLFVAGIQEPDLYMLQGIGIGFFDATIFVLIAKSESTF